MFDARGGWILVILAGFALVGCVSDGADTIGPRGGEVTSADGRLTIVIDPDTFDRQVEVAIVESDRCAAGSIACYAILPEGTMAMPPVSLAFDIGGIEMGADPEDLSMFFEMGGSWVECPDRDFDAEDEVVMGSLSYFGALAIELEP